MTDEFNDVIATPVTAASNDQRVEDYEYDPTRTVTTSWMTEQQSLSNVSNYRTGGRARGGRKGYGRRFSNASSASVSNGFGGGSKATRSNRKADDWREESDKYIEKDKSDVGSASSFATSLFGKSKFGSSPSFDDDDSWSNNNDLSHTTPAKGIRSMACSSSVSNISIGGTFGSLEEENEDDSDGNVEVSKPKKKRPNLPLPPASASASVSSYRTATSRAASRRAIFTPNNTKPSLSEIDFEREGVREELREDLEYNFIESPPLIGGRGAIKRSNIGLRRSQSVVGTSSSSSSFSSQHLFEENVHPNDTSYSTSSQNSFLDKKPEPFTRPRTRANSKKRTATSGSDHVRCGLSFRSELEPSPPKIATRRSSSLASFPSRSFSSSMTSCAPSCASSKESGAEGAALGESFSSLAKRGHTQSWADGTNDHKSTTAASSGTHHARSFSALGGASSGAFRTPSIKQSSASSHQRSYSQPVGVDLTDFKSGGSPPFPSPALSTPSVRSTSSRKRGMFTSSPVMDEAFENDEGGRFSAGSISVGTYTFGDGSERVRSRSRVFAPSPMGQVDDEVAAPFSSFKRTSSEPTNMFSPPTIGGGFLNDELCLVGDDDDFLDDNKRGSARDIVSTSWMQESDNESMVSVCSNSSSVPASSDEEESCNAEEAHSPKEMSDAEIFESKPSYDDFKYLAKMLQKWSFKEQKSSVFSASMGLNKGCMIGVTPTWTYEHKTNFIKWAVTAFGFRVGNVGGVHAGQYLLCSEVAGKEALTKLKRILNDYKVGKFDPPSGDNECIEVCGSKAESEMLNPHPVPAPQKLGPGLKLKPSGQSSFPRSCRNSTPVTMPFCDDFVGDMLADEMKNVYINEKKLAKNTSLSSCSRFPQIVRSISLQPLTKKGRQPTLPCFQNSPMFDIDCKIKRLSRRSEENAINGSDFMNQIYSTDASPSPHNKPFPRRLRDRTHRVHQPLRTSFERPMQGLKPFESPHPRSNSLTQQTPSRLDFGMETPMPKQVQHWGSRPISGKDWGDSICCDEEIIQTCTRIFAKSWLTSEFHKSEEICAEYRILPIEEHRASLNAFFDAFSDLVDEDNASIDSRDSADFNESSRSFGDSVLARLHIDDDAKQASDMLKHDRRRSMKLAKFARMTLCASASDFLQPKQYISNSPRQRQSQSSGGVPFDNVMKSSAFCHVLSYLSEGELIHSASLVCRKWAESATESLCTLMLISVGCDPSFMTDGNEDEMSESDEIDACDTRATSLESSSIAKSMGKDWPSLMMIFPWARFLSDGAFKRVYKVWNDHIGAYEALSVMDVDEINESGNLSLVGAELAVSVLLSSMSRRNICPNFVITRGVFTCQHEPPSHWGSKDNTAPRGNTYGGNSRSRKAREPKPGGQLGNYQYIRMELCQHGDMEEFMKTLPGKMLAPWDCRNLLFQMAFALHVAGDRFGLKHYDVKLLNFFLQSAREPTIAEDEHPHVVLRYGVGFSVFRLRMHPSSAFIAKLADYGTSVLRTDTDGQPISLGQFTTIENTPPDFLILGNSAKQGYGHDCFGLGLCMLHLFTGHAPYEEILKDVVCPKNLKEKLKRIWRESSYDVIRSVIVNGVDDDGNEIEDETLYDTLYRFLVLFGIPEHQFSSKENGKVWRAINSTLLSPSKPNCKKCPDVDAYKKDKQRFSLLEGNDKMIANARIRLGEINGAMDVLLSLVSFDPNNRATPLDVINSKFMSGLIEDPNVNYCNDDIVKSYTAYLTQ